jgi:hypothetical protein
MLKREDIIAYARDARFAPLPGGREFPLGKSATDFTEFTDLKSLRNSAVELERSGIEVDQKRQPWFWGSQIREIRFCFSSVGAAKWTCQLSAVIGNCN